MTKTICIDGTPASGKSSIIGHMVNTSEGRIRSLPELREFGIKNMGIDLDQIAAERKTLKTLRAAFYIEAARKQALAALLKKKPEAILIDKSILFNIASAMAQNGTAAFAAAAQNSAPRGEKKEIPIKLPFGNIICPDAFIYIDRSDDERETSLRDRGGDVDEGLITSTCGDGAYAENVRKTHELLTTMFRRVIWTNDAPDLGAACDDFSKKLQDIIAMPTPIRTHALRAITLN